LFGAALAHHCQSSFCRWHLGEIAGGSAIGDGATAAVLFGAASARDLDNSFEGWNFNGFSSATLTVTAGCSAAVFGSAGGAGAERSFRDWTFCNFLSDNAICAVSCGSGEGGKFATVFGASRGEWDDSSFGNWSAEFSDGQLIAAMAECGEDPSDVHVSGLGGWTNENMRFYFNGLGAEISTPATATVAAAKIEKISEMDGHLEVVLAERQCAGGDFPWCGGFDSMKTSDFDLARALSLGDGFQINVGRRREMEFKEISSGGANGAALLRQMETESSAMEGGIAADGAGSAGVLNLIGAVARTPLLAMAARSPEGTTMRIDGGWTVNCLGPVKDLRTIDLLSGRLVLVSRTPDSAIGEDVRNGAFSALGNGLAISTGGKIYRGTVDGGAGVLHRDGGISLSYNSYPTAGALLLSDGDTICYHIGEETFSGIEDFGSADGLFACKPKGIVELLGYDGGMLTFESGWSFSLSGCDVLPDNMLLVLAKAPGDATESLVDGLTFEDIGSFPVRDVNFVGFGEGNDCEVGLLRVCDYVDGVPDPFSLYWFENPSTCGLALAKTMYAPESELPVTNPEWPQFPVGEVAEDKVRIARIMGMTPDFDGRGIFCRAFADIENRRVDSCIRCGFYSATVGAALGVSGRAVHGHQTFRATVFGATARSVMDSHLDRLFHGVRHDLAAVADFRWSDECFDDLKTYAKGKVSICRGKMNCRREDSAGEVYRCEFRDSDWQIELEVRQGLLREGEAELGIFGEMRHDQLVQCGFLENGYGRWSNISAIRHRFLTTTLGLSVETIRPSRLQLLAKLGWQCGVLRKNGIAYEMRSDVGAEVFSPQVSYGDRHGAMAHLGACYGINGNWDCSFDFSGLFSRRSAAAGAAITFSRKL
ncbi:MAG: hypothetical protein LBI39_00655, partial [Puniceicoccales bacterium]|nr:hypothetical protein [Puniceicoccales bacterium]